MDKENPANFNKYEVNDNKDYNVGDCKKNLLRLKNIRHLILVVKMSAPLRGEKGDFNGYKAECVNNCI